MNHSFDVNIAKEYGILEAVLIDHFNFWIDKARANKVHYHDGDYWTYNSMSAFEELFPYATRRQLERAIGHLREAGILKTGNYNKQPYDRTLWYTLTEKGKEISHSTGIDTPEIGKCISPTGEMDTPEKGKCISPVGEMDSRKKGNAFTPEVEPIPVTDPDIYTYNKKEIIKEKNESTYFPNPELNTAFLGFIKNRKDMHKPMTAHAIELAKRRLEKMASDDERIKSCMQSIERCYMGLFPVDREVQCEKSHKDEKKEPCPYHAYTPEELAAEQEAEDNAMAGASTPEPPEKQTEYESDEDLENLIPF